MRMTALVALLGLAMGSARAEETPPIPYFVVEEEAQVQPPKVQPPKVQPEPLPPPVVVIPQAAAPVSLSPLSLPASTTPEMLGDLLLPPPVCVSRRGITICTQPPPQGAALPASFRGFKIADGDSPRPLDRVYFLFNFYDEVNQAANLRFGVPIQDIKVYRETFGLEKTFLDGDASIGFRLPLNTLSAQSDDPAMTGSSTDLGDLLIILKYAYWQNRETGDLLSAGLVVGAPTGPEAFAGFDELLDNFQSTTLQPFLGFIFGAGPWYVHGFSSVIVPTDSHDVTLLFNDYGLGYFLYSTPDASRFLTALGPTFEVHVNTPLNHRGQLRLDDPAATPDIVDLTGGINIEFFRRARLAVGVGAPVTGPRPFNLEVLAQFRILFGPSVPAQLYDSP